ncbi:penicillin-binding protein, putative [Planobispora rosea]|uniref:Penicillin-binding protein, putative n=1 Tax=Planobispora rosea TaxID=35762 RepID=A0A8J3WE51_PLARO|nr:penicillin-binding transpeptidase domain-containing protein [Planobispora rosea]GGS79636.1 penicillin-binding protein, putative [Planobispora rosea]GIH85848.1 penicillin-binding protein, putative [Planobispora rosea]
MSAALALAVTVPMMSSCLDEPSAHEAVRDFLVGWQTGDYSTAARRTDGDERKVRKALEDAKIQLDAASFRFALKGIRSSDGRAEADFAAEIDLGENNPLWEYDGRLPLHLVNGQWKVRWSPSVLHPRLREGQRFAVKPDPEDRHPIVDRAGDPLQELADLHVATVIPARLKDPAALCEQLAKLTGFPKDRLLSRILSASPSMEVPLVTFSRTRFARLRQQLEAIEGLRFSIRPQAVAPASPVQIVGAVTAVTPETEQQLGGPQRAGDTVGRDGLQKAYQEHLTGSTQTSVITVDLKTLEEVEELAKWRPGRTATPVHTTLDRHTQRAADAALATGGPGMVVAVQGSTGEVWAVSATKEYHQETDALAGKFPAGTAFSIVAVEALLKAQVDLKQKLPCPADRTVGGVRFRQTGSPAGSQPTLQGSFANACVTALASLARRVDPAALRGSATAFGIGSSWTLPLRSFSGSMGPLKNDAATARAITGQNVLVSPLSMALVAGAVASGTWRPPVLVLEPKTTDLSTETEKRKPVSPVKLDDKTVSTLRALMRTAVTSGSARAATAPGDPVHGVTAAASREGRALSWFVGWQGDIAVAVLVENPDPTAGATVAGRFFQHLREGT